MPPWLARISRELGVPEDRILWEALEAWLCRRIADIDHRIAALADRYGTASPDAIVGRIREGSVAEHPAWEDAIQLEALQGHRDRLWWAADADQARRPMP